MKKRIITAIIALIIVVPLIILGGNFYAFLIGMVGVFSLKEIFDINEKQIPNLIKVLSLISLLLLIFSNYGISSDFNISYPRLALSIMLMVAPLIFYDKKEYSSNTAFYILGFIIFLGLGFNILLLLRNNIKLLLYLLMIPVFNDIFAYVFGIKFGKHKLCKGISPKKSIEGSIMGLILGSIISIIAYYLFFNVFNFKLIIVSILLSFMGQIGDLIFSKMKRDNEIKDFSNLLPGHGGMLDRLDSTIIVLITYILISFWL